MVEWLEIQGTDGAYSVNQLGEIRSNDRVANDSRKIKSRIMHTYKIKPRGYHTVVFWINGKKKHYLVHRLVYMTFNNIDIDTKIDIDHIDNNPDNNMLSNLRALTRSENIIAGINNRITNENYTIPVYNGSESGKIGNHKRIQMCNSNGDIINTFNSLVEAENITGVNRNNISRALRGIFKHSGGYIWKYVD